jgi:hypothetical protein
MTCPEAARVRIPKTKVTWRMTREELARVWADHHGIHAHVNGGGWLYTKDDRPYVQGWDALGERLELAGIITVGKGISWRR